MSDVDPDAFVITKKRKKYKFALFHNSALCFEYEQWDASQKVDCVEVGAGTALFSVMLAEQYPDKRFVAVDVKADRLQHGAKVAANKGLKNVMFIRTRADQIPELFPPQSVEVLWLTFPDPYPKSRSAKRRLTHPVFLSVYKYTLSPTGKLFFKTDARDLFDWSIEQLVSDKWQIDQLTYDLHNSALNTEYKFMTTYEQRFTAEGLSTMFLRAKPQS